MLSPETRYLERAIYIVSKYLSRKSVHDSNAEKTFICLQIGNEGLAADLTDDPDTEEALKEFDFLVTAEDGEGAGEARSSGDGTEWGKMLTEAFRNKYLVHDSAQELQYLLR